MRPVTLNLTGGRKWYGSMEDCFTLCRIQLENGSPFFTQTQLDGLDFARGHVGVLQTQEWVT